MTNLNLSPDTLVRWTGGCWSPLPEAQQPAASASRPAPSLGAAPLRKTMALPRAHLGRHLGDLRAAVGGH